MSLEDFENQFEEVLENIIISGLKSHQFISALYDRFTEKSNKYNNELQIKNEILSNTMERIAEVFGVAYTHSFTLKDLDKNTQKLKDLLFGVKDSKGIKNTYLCYCGGDDCGHSFCDVITEKKMNHIQWTLEDDNISLEHVFYYEDSIVRRAVCERLGYDENTFDDMTESMKTDAIEKFFQQIIEDENVSLRLFSEYAENIIGNGRHSGRSSRWIEL